MSVNSEEVPSVEKFTTPVLIVGGGGSGLCSSLFLAQQGIASIVVERYPGVTPLPKAHYLNPRTMEIFRSLGLANEIYALSTPAENMSSVGWYTSLAGTGPLDGKLIHEMDAFGGGSLTAQYESHSPCRAANFAQMYLEPLLYQNAAKNKLVTLLYGHELIGFETSDDRVVGRVRPRESSDELVIEADFMLACDGGRFVGPSLGIRMEGVERMVDMVTVHFAADLSSYIDDDSKMIRWFSNPEAGGSWSSGVMVAMGPKHYDRHSETWLMHFAFDPGSAQFKDEELLKNKIIELLRVAEDTEISVCRTNSWEVQGVLAETFRRDRIFLVGDAAHRHPPTTGLGLNSAIQDAHNLAWKLAYVLKGAAGPDLLASYEAERRAVTARNVEWALMTFQNTMVVDAAIGLMHGAPPEINRLAFEKLFADNPDGVSRRHLVKELLNTQRCEFQAEDMEIGFAYSSHAVIDDGTPPPERCPLGCEHRPMARPGHRLPHLWLNSDAHGQSTIDLVDNAGFVLLLNGAIETWQQHIARLPSENIPPLEIIDLSQVDSWGELAGLMEDGALLVRPDGHVAWRYREFDDRAVSALSDALDKILSVRMG